MFRSNDGGGARAAVPRAGGGRRRGGAGGGGAGALHGCRRARLRHAPSCARADRESRCTVHHNGYDGMHFPFRWHRLNSLFHPPRIVDTFQFDT